MEGYTHFQNVNVNDIHFETTKQEILEGTKIAEGDRIETPLEGWYKKEKDNIHYNYRCIMAVGDFATKKTQIFDGYVNILSDPEKQQQDRKLEKMVAVPLKDVTVPSNQAGNNFKTKYGADATFKVAEIDAKDIKKYGIVKTKDKTIIVEGGEDFNLTELDTYNY